MYKCGLHFYLPILFSESILWWQRVVSLSHLNQPLLLDILLLQQPHTSGQLKQLADIRSEILSLDLELKIFSPMRLILLVYTRYLDDVFGRNWGRFRGGFDIHQGV